MAQKYWVADSGALWSDSSNWSLTSGGQGGTPSPTFGDIVNFDSSGRGACYLDQTAQMSGLYLQNAVITSEGQGSYTMTVDGTVSLSGVAVLDIDTPGSYFKVLECLARPCVIESDCTVGTLVLGEGYFRNGYEERTDATLHLVGNLYGSPGFGIWNPLFNVPIKFDGSVRQYIYNTTGCIYPSLIIDKT